jgi:glycosyltransferase involved in cell wall biosynthesis
MFVIPTLGAGGAERVASILANNFIKENEVEFFLLEQSECGWYQLNEDIVIKGAKILVKRGNKIKVVGCYIRNFIKQRNSLRNEIGNFKPNVVISFLPKADMLMATLVSKESFRWISSERNDPMSRSRIERVILNNIYKKTNALVCQTKKVEAYYKAKGVKRTIVIRNPLILNRDIDIKFKVDDKYIISVGRLDRQKNYQLLIKAFSLVKEKLKCEEKLYILGDGPEASLLKELINKLGMKDEILLLGRKSNVTDYLFNATAFVMSSNYEGLPNAMLEALAAGLPIISTDFFTGVASEFVDDKNGILVSVNNIEEMENAIANILRMSKEKLHDMGEASRKKVVELDADTISGQWSELLKEC